MPPFGRAGPGGPPMPMGRGGMMGMNTANLGGNRFRLSLTLSCRRTPTSFWNGRTTTRHAYGGSPSYGQGYASYGCPSNGRSSNGSRKGHASYWKRPVKHRLTPESKNMYAVAVKLCINIIQPHKSPLIYKQALQK
jgi:hypothetical protein